MTKSAFTPKVSVIIPVFCVEQYIERCARSLFEQTLDSIEYLFVDDCTPDNSIEVLNKVLSDYPQRKNHVIIHRMDNNSGQAAVRKWGIQKASGEYVIHCDSDDWIDVDMYEAMYNKAISDDLDLVYCGHEETNGEDVLKTFFRNVNGFDHDALVNKALSSDVLNSLWACLVKRELLCDIIYPIGNMAEDKTIMIQLCLLEKNAGSIEKAFYHYLRHVNSITTQVTNDIVEKKMQDVFNNMTIILDIFKHRNLLANYHDSIVAYIVYTHRVCLKSSNTKVVRRRILSLFNGITKHFLTNSFIDRNFKIKLILKILCPKTIYS